MYLESFKTGSRSLDFMHMHLVKPQLSFSIKAIESYVQSPIPIKLSLYSQFSPCGHLTIADKSQPPAEMHKEMTVINSCYYGLLLLWKCGCFHAPPPLLPQCNVSLFFFLSLEQTLKYFFQNIDSHNIKQHYNKRK